MADQVQINLLCVDDDPGFRKVTTHLLSKYAQASFVMTWKEDGESALVEIENNKTIDMVLLDYNLPDKNGLEVTRQIRELGLATPIVFLSGQREFRLAIEAIKYRVEDYLVKEDVLNASFPSTIHEIFKRTEKKRADAERFRNDLITRRKSDAVKELIVTVCHEFNNPLAAMKISTDILKRQKLSSNEEQMVKDLDRRIRMIESEITKLRDMNLDRIEFKNL